MIETENELYFADVDCKISQTQLLSMGTQPVGLDHERQSSKG